MQKKIDSYLFTVSSLLLFYWEHKIVLQRYLNQVPVVDPITTEFGRDDIIEVPRRQEFTHNPVIGPYGPMIGPEIMIIIEEPSQIPMFSMLAPLLGLTN